LDPTSLTFLEGNLALSPYGYKFVPFSDIDHYQKCVTFGVALLSDETIESFCWMLEAFLKTHKKQPPFAVTDQDGALRNAVVKMFPDSHHRLLMWHITEKLSRKVLGDLAADTKFRKDFHKLVWNVYIGPEVFEQRWDDMITRYNLHDNKWLSDMYTIRKRWVPGYFKEVPMCGLMKITSRSEKKQRYIQRVLDNASNGSTPSIFTQLSFEKHVCAVYTPSIFREGQEIEYSYRCYGCVESNGFVIKTPRSIFRSKGTRRMKSPAEIGKAKTIARTNRKVPFKRHTCSACGGKGHNKATCKGCSACDEAGHHKGICKRFPNQDKGGGSGKNVVIDDELDNEDEVDDEDEVDNKDEVDDEDEVDEEYESEEE
ncbi:FAR1-related sequence 5-like protein, partial [Tanacetum coccineum]